jgi:hypothetical protein
MAHFGVLRDTQDTPVRRRIYEKVRHVVTLLARIYNMFEPRLTSNQQIKEFIRNATQDMAYVLPNLKPEVRRDNTARIVGTHKYNRGPIEFELKPKHVWSIRFFDESDLGYNHSNTLVFPKDDTSMGINKVGDLYLQFRPDPNLRPEDLDMIEKEYESSYILRTVRGRRGLNLDLFEQAVTHPDLAFLAKVMNEKYETPLTWSPPQIPIGPQQVGKATIAEKGTANLGRFATDAPPMAFGPVYQGASYKDVHVAELSQSFLELKNFIFTLFDPPLRSLAELKQIMRDQHERIKIAGRARGIRNMWYGEARKLTHFPQLVYPAGLAAGVAESDRFRFRGDGGITVRVPPPPNTVRPDKVWELDIYRNPMPLMIRNKTKTDSDDLFGTLLPEGIPQTALEIRGREKPRRHNDLTLNLDELDKAIQSRDLGRFLNIMKQGNSDAYSAARRYNLGLETGTERPPEVKPNMKHLNPENRPASIIASFLGGPVRQDGPLQQGQTQTNVIPQTPEELQRLKKLSSTIQPRPRKTRRARKARKTQKNRHK